MTSERLAIITGITGQDGRILASYLIKKGYRVVGISRRTSTQSIQLGGELANFSERVRIVNGDINDQQFLYDLIEAERPAEFYNCAAESFVERSWSQPLITAESTALAVIKELEAIRKFSPLTRFFQAASSEIFGKAMRSPQTEESELAPRSPYATSKLFSYWSVKNYRERYGLFACNGIMYNHESVQRGLEFVTRKITYTAAQIKLGLVNHLTLGSLDAVRDWGWAEDYVDGMWLMLQQEHPDDFILATGKLHSVRDFVRLAFDHVGLEWERYVRLDPQYARSAEPVPLCGDASKARRLLGWTPQTELKTIVARMVDFDLRSLANGR
jgi:GDPmannose 4,6-dehydratase